MVNVRHLTQRRPTPLPVSSSFLFRHPHRLHLPITVPLRPLPRHHVLTPASGSHTHTSHTSSPAPHHHPHHHAHSQHDHAQAHHQHRLITGSAAVPIKTVSTFISQTSYQMMKVLSLPTYGKLALMVVCTAPIVLCGAGLYAAVGKKEWPQALSKAFYTVTDAPDFTEEEDNKAAAGVLLLLHVLGILTFASIIGILSNDVASAVETVNKGNYNLQENKHTVLLGWNKHTVSLLKQILIAQKERQGGSFRTPVVVLAAREKEEMDAELEDELGKEVMGSTVITRSGNPLRMSDMERVAAGRAGTVVVMCPGDDELLTAGTKLAVVLSNLNGLSSNQQNIILESFGDKDDLRDTAAEVLVQEMSLSNRITTVQGLQNMQDLMAQCSIQPGLSFVLNQLTTQSEGCEFYIKALPSLEGRSFREARRMFHSATLCGLFDGAGALLLNPDDSALIGPGATLLFLASDDNHLTPLPDTVCPLPVEQSLQRKGGAVKNILVLSHTPNVSSLVESVHKFAPHGSHITVFTQQPVTHRSTGSGKTRYLTGNLSSTQALVDAGVREADSVIIHNLMEGVEDCVLDAQVVASVLQLQGALVQPQPQQQQQRSNQPLGVVCCIADPDTTTILTQAADLLSLHSTRGRRVVLDVIDTSNILGGILTQIGSEPLLQSVFAELLDSAEGNEVYMREPAQYSILQGVQYEWAQAQEAVRSRGDLLIGVTTRSGHTRLALPRSAEIRLEEGDTLVVLGRWLG